MSESVPLPEPVGIVWSDGMPHHTYVKGQLHAHAAAVSAAENAALLARVKVLEDALGQMPPVVLYRRS